jgi:hypothetical protein
MPTSKIVTINRSIEDVFTFVSDHTNNTLWKHFIVESKQLSSNPIDVGTTFEVTSVVGKRRFSSLVEVTKYEPYCHYAYKSHAQPLPFIASLNFEPDENGTAISGDVQFNANGIYALLSPLLLFIICRQSKGTFAKLKQVMENSSSNS